MDHPGILEVSYDEQHDPEASQYDVTTETHEPLEELASFTEPAVKGYEEAYPSTEEGPDCVIWGVLAAVCFFAGLSLGLILYFKSEVALSVVDWFRRRCCGLCGGSSGEPVRLTVVDRQASDAEGKRSSSDSSSDDEGKGKNDKRKETPKVTFQVSESEGDGGSAGAKAEKSEEVEVKVEVERRAPTDGGKEAEEEQGRAAASEAGEENTENQDTKDEHKTDEACENKACEDEKKADSSSSSSSSSDEEDEEKNALRQRKKAAAEAAQEGEDEAKPEDKGDAEHQE